MDRKNTLQWLRAKLVDANREKEIIESSIKHLEADEEEKVEDKKCDNCGHSIFAHWNDCKTLNCPTDCMIDKCDCKEFTHESSGYISNKATEVKEQ